MRRLTALTAFASLAILISSSSVVAQLDPSFGSGGRSIRVFAGGETVVKSFLLPDGKFLALTRNTSSGNQWPVTYHFVRFNSDGTTDLSYGTNGSTQLPIPFVSTGFLNYGINDAVRQLDGRIVLVGYDDSNGLVLRLNENGTLDPSFSDDGIHRPNIDQTDSDVLSRVLYQSDGRIVVIGHPNLNGSNRMFLIRYLSNGTLDVTFGNLGGFVIHSIPVVNFTGLERQSNGNYIALSRGWSGAPTLVGKAYCFENDGAHNASFVSPEFGDFDALKLVRLANDKLIVAGNPYYLFLREIRC